MPKYDYHICFVSGQNVAEFLGALLPELGAAHIHAIVTPKMRKQGANLENTCKRRGLKYTSHPLERIGITEIGDLLDSIWLAHPDASQALNITGGTKIMSLAAYAWAIKNSVAAFYVDTAAKCALVYDKDGWETVPIPAILDFEALLNLYGYEIMAKIGTPISAVARNAIEKLLELGNRKKTRRAMGFLNEKAAKAKDAPHLAVSYYHDDGVAEALEICKSAGKLDYTDSTIIFRDEEARKWCNGGWLEEYVQAILSRLEAEGRISSWASGVQVIREGSRNELDAIFTANNRLYVIECKTSRMDEKNSPSSILYKADSINGRLGGIFTKSMLCSINPLEAFEMRRATNMGIKPVIGPALRDLRKILIEWMAAE